MKSIGLAKAVVFRVETQTSLQASQKGGRHNQSRSKSSRVSRWIVRCVRSRSRSSLASGLSFCLAIHSRWAIANHLQSPDAFIGRPAEVSQPGGPSLRDDRRLGLQFAGTTVKNRTARQ